MNQVLTVFEESLLLHRQVASDLQHPLRIWMVRDAGKMDFSGVELDKE
jgi:hypothetical protein